MISIIIPTLNEEAYISKTIERIKRASSDTLEIIVVDAHSEDETELVVRQWPDVVFIQDKKLRAKKYLSLNLGAKMSKGDILLFLDADTLLPRDFGKMIKDSLKGRVVGGAFELSFDKSNTALKMVVYLNSLRYKLTNHFYGDQAIFCTREAFIKVGGFPEKSIMEAKYFCKLLKKKGKLKLIKESVVSSSRRFYSGGVLKVLLKDLVIYVYDELGLNTQKLAENYWLKEK